MTDHKRATNNNEQQTTQCYVQGARLFVLARSQASRVYDKLISWLASCRCCGALYTEKVGVANYMNSELNVDSTIFLFVSFLLLFKSKVSFKTQD